MQPVKVLEVLLWGTLTFYNVNFAGIQPVKVQTVLFFSIWGLNLNLNLSLLGAWMLHRPISTYLFDPTNEINIKECKNYTCWLCIILRWAHKWACKWASKWALPHHRCTPWPFCTWLKFPINCTCICAHTLKAPITCARACWILIG